MTGQAGGTEGWPAAPVEAGPTGIRIAPAAAVDRPAWTALRRALWPDSDPADMAMPVDQHGAATWLAWDGEQAIGFGEASLRHDYVNGCDTTPVLFAEGLYVAPAWRRRGVARALVAAMIAWGRDLGLTEFAADALVENEASHAMLRALSLIETERVVFFRALLS